LGVLSKVKATDQGGVARALFSLGKDVVTSVTTEAVTEASQEVITTGAGELSKEVAEAFKVNKDFEETNPEYMKIIAEQANAGGKGALFFAALFAPFHAPVITRKIIENRNYVKKMSEIRKVIVEQKKGLDKASLNQLLKLSGLEFLYINQETLKEANAQKDIAYLSQLLKEHEKESDILAGSTDIEAPTATILTQPDEVFEAVKPHLKETPESISEAEEKSYAEISTSTETKKHAVKLLKEKYEKTVKENLSNWENEARKKAVKISKSQWDGFKAEQKVEKSLGVETGHEAVEKVLEKGKLDRKVFDKTFSFAERPSEQVKKILSEKGKQLEEFYQIVESATGVSDAESFINFLQETKTLEEETLSNITLKKAEVFHKMEVGDITSKVINKKTDLAFSTMENKTFSDSNLDSNAIIKILGNKTFAFRNEIDNYIKSNLRVSALEEIGSQAGRKFIPKVLEMPKAETASDFIDTLSSVWKLKRTALISGELAKKITKRRRSAINLFKKLKPGQVEELKHIGATLILKKYGLLPIKDGGGKASKLYAKVDKVLKAGLPEGRIEELFVNEFEETFSFPAQDWLIKDLSFEGALSPYSELTYDKAKHVLDAYNYLMNKGLNLVQAYELQEQERVDAAVQMIAKEAEGIPNQVKYPKGSKKRRLSDLFQSIMAQLDPLEYVLDRLAFGDLSYKERNDTAVYKYITKPLSDGQARYLTTIQKLRAETKPHWLGIEKAINAMPKAIHIPDVVIPDILKNDGVISWSPEALFSIVFNSGTEDGLKKLKAGYGITSQNVLDIMAYLKQSDLDNVQAILDVFQTTFPAVAETHFKTKFFTLEKVNAYNLIEESGGVKGDRVFRGGYYPLKYDYNLTMQEIRKGLSRNEMEKEAEILKKHKNAMRSYSVLQIPEGVKDHITKERTPISSRFIDLKLSVGLKHMEDVALYVGFTEAVDNAVKFIENPKMKELIMKKIGVQGYSSIISSLIFLTNPAKGNLEVEENRWAAKLRYSAIPYFIGLNFKTAVKTTSSSLAGVNRIGVKYYAKGAARVLKNPAEAFSFMTAVSPVMKERVTAADREVKQLIGREQLTKKLITLGGKSFTATDVQNGMLIPIIIGDTMTVLPLWYGAFAKGRELYKGSDFKAVQYADKVILRTQPSSLPLNMSYFQRAGGLASWLSLFSTWSIGTYGAEQRYARRAVQAGKLTYPQFAAFKVIEGVAPFLLLNTVLMFLYGGDVTDKEEQTDVLIGSLLDTIFTGVPGGSALRYPFINVGSSPITKGVELAKNSVLSMWDVTSTIALGKRPSSKKLEKFAWAAADMVSFYTKIPASQIYRRIRKGMKQKKENIPGVKYIIPAPEK